jgi:hypothetical protein
MQTCYGALQPGLFQHGAALFDVTVLSIATHGGWFVTARTLKSSTATAHKHSTQPITVHSGHALTDMKHVVPPRICTSAAC